MPMIRYKPRVLFFHEMSWCLGQIAYNVARELHYKYYIDFYDWRACDQRTYSVLNHYDLIVSTVPVGLGTETSPGLKNYDARRLALVGHGLLELSWVNWAENTRQPAAYGAVCKPAQRVLAAKAGQPVFLTRYGVEPQRFRRRLRDGSLKTIGWCGADNGFAVKRPEWAKEIAAKAGKELLFSGTGFDWREMESWYRNIDLLLVTSSSEGGPTPPFEAIACGVPVVSTRIGNIQDVVGPKYDTIDEAVTIIQQLSKSAAEMRDLANAQYDDVITNWTYEVLAPEWATMIDHALEISATGAL